MPKRDWWSRFKAWVKDLFDVGDAPGSIQSWPPVPPPSEPSDCPVCSGEIELVGPSYICRGNKWAGEDPCGWKAPAADFGRTWA